MIARIAAVLLPALLAGCAATTPRATPDAPPLAVLSFNVRLPVEADGADRWDARRDIAMAMLRDADADLIGTQELFAAQGNDIAARLPHYTWFGRGRRGNDAHHHAPGDAIAPGDDEHMGVFYRSDRLRLLDSGDFWLSDTPNVPGSITWGNLYPRLVTWGRFERIADRRRFTLFNTHLPYRDEDEPARVRGARLLAARIAALPRDEPVVVTGDFNVAPGTGVHAALLGAGLRDAWTDASTRAGPDGTFHGFTGTPGERIDWILVRGFDVQAMRTIDTHRGRRYPSDHFPLRAQLAFR